MTDYRNIQDLDEFDDLVENFVKNRKQLKQKVKEERGDLSRKKADAKLKAEPITESIAELKSSLADKGGFLKMFERFSGVSKSQSEIKLTTKASEGRLGTHGFVDLADLQDGVLRVRNSQTGDSFNVTLDEDLAELLFKPYRNIDLDEIDNQALNLYYQIMRVAGISPRANNNNKIRRARQVYNAVNQQAPFPAQPPAQPPMPPAQPPRRPPIRPEDIPEREGKYSDSDEMSEGDVIQEEERGRPVRSPDKYTGRKYKGRLDASNEERRAIKREEKIEKKISDVGGRRSKRRTQEAQQLRQRRRNQPLQNEEDRHQFYEPFMRRGEMVEMVRNPLDPAEERGQVYAMDRNYFTRKRAKRGRGLMSGDEMIERFYLLSQSMNAGNESDELLEEMMDLLDALLQNQYITQFQHKTLYDNYIRYD
jgi:hypothetical protein